MPKTKKIIYVNVEKVTYPHDVQSKWLFLWLTLKTNLSQIHKEKSRHRIDIKIIPVVNLA